MGSRLERLKARVLADFASCRGSRLTDPDEGAALARLVAREYGRSAGAPEVERKASFLAAFAGEMPIRLRPDELILGSQRFMAPPWEAILGAATVQAMQWRGNLGHIVVDYGRVLHRGLAGLGREIAAMRTTDAVSRRNQLAFARSVEALSCFIGRHGEAAAAAGDARLSQICAWVRERPPCTFHQALQLTWFVHLFLHAESPGTAAISFGRLDQYLWPFLRRDLEEGILDLAQARELLACFWLKCCEGDESQNLVVGGCDGEGQPAENPLSLLCLEVCGSLRLWQPSLSVRLGPGSPEGFRRAAFNLCLQGFGMPSFLNDPVIIRALQAVGIPLSRARDYGIVGCYEATPQGDTTPYTVAGRILLPQLVREYVDVAQADTYEAFENGFARFLTERYLETILPGFEQSWAQRARDCASPFESVCVTGCLDSGRCAEEGGARFSLYGVNILGLGTAVDSLQAVRDLVYRERALTLRELRQTLASDFADGTASVAVGLAPIGEDVEIGRAHV